MSHSVHLLLGHAVRFIQNSGDWFNGVVQIANPILTMSAFCMDDGFLFLMETMFFLLGIDRNICYSHDSPVTHP
jgi:hypothetical protein